MSSNSTDPGESEAFQRLLSHLERELDFESSYYNESYLDRRISARMRRRDVDDYDAYLDLVRADPEEPTALLDSLSINVTSFYRNPEAWEPIREVLREVTAGRGATTVWSAPCSDGREPYSLAMLALDDDEIRTRRLTVLGTDINADVLERAREGVYETTKTRDVAAELEPLDDAEEYVDRDGDTFTVRDEVRNLVEFEQHDLIADEPKRGVDLVLCRNLLIYINTESKRAVVDTVLSSLREGGYLVIGMTETLPRESRSAVETVDKRRRVYRRE
jgi:chemotaxis protein methyltransferase CheR